MNEDCLAYDDRIDKCSFNPFDNIDCSKCKFSEEEKKKQGRYLTKVRLCIFP